MKLSNRNIFALLAASASLLTSCSDDVLYKDEIPGGENQGVILYLPEMPADQTPATGTRAEGQLAGFTRSETTFDNRRVFIYPVNNDGTVDDSPIELDIKGQTPIRTSNGYAAYKLDIPTGSYKMYVTANIELGDNIKRSELLAMDVAVPTDLDKGLPMSCSNEELQVSYGDGVTSALGNSSINIAPGAENVTIKANLKYCVSKVRVTMINDLSPTDLVKGIKVTNHLSTSSIFPDVRDTKEKEDAYKASQDYTVTSGKYFNAVTVDAAGVSKTNVDELGSEISVAEGNTTPYTHQAVFYVPERIFQTSSDNVTMHVTVGGVEKVIAIGHEENGNKIVKRSHFYDYVGASDGKFYLQVQPWDIETMIGALNGPTFLHVDKTSIDVQAGYQTEMWYDTNASSIETDCAEYNGQKIFHFITKEDAPNTLIIEMNSEIDRAEFNDIPEEDKKWFTIKAGTIKKKIAVNLTFDEFILLENDMVTIDVAENKESGRYNGNYKVTLRTNLDNISLEKVKWGENTTEGTPHSLMLTSDGTIANVLDLSQPIPVVNGEVTFYINFNDLNSSRKLWKEDSEMAVKVSGTTSTGENREALVNVYVRAAYDTYRIHFYAADWNHPHIYVYQCLKLPSDQTLTNGATKGMPVGENKDRAALEYDFTGGVAFKGWNVGAYNDPNAAGSKEEGFWLFSGSGSWAPTRGGDDFDKHYYALDFAAAHRTKLKTAGPNGSSLCTECTKDDFPSSWPGIHMLPDPEMGDGWWTFELSGVADTGKALIMFTDCSENDHGYGDWMENGHRYPKKDLPGVALFDYPTKEGWFEYKTNAINLSFSAFEPGSEPETIRIYRIYWPYSSSWKGLNIWQGGTVWGNDDYNSWPNNQATRGGSYKQYNDSYAYIEVRTLNTEMTGSLSYQSKNGTSYSTAKTLNFSNFTKTLENGNDVYSYTITSLGNGYGGVPSGSPVVTGPTEGSTTSTFEVGKKYAIIFSNSHSIWMWGSTKNEAITEKQGYTWDAQPQDAQYEFTTSTAGETQMKYKLDKADEVYTVNVGEFKYSTTNSRYEAKINK